MPQLIVFTGTISLFSNWQSSSKSQFEKNRVVIHIFNFNLWVDKPFTLHTTAQTLAMHWWRASHLRPSAIIMAFGLPGTNVMQRLNCRLGCARMTREDWMPSHCWPLHSTAWSIKCYMPSAKSSLRICIRDSPPLKLSASPQAGKWKHVFCFLETLWVVFNMTRLTF